MFPKDRHRPSPAKTPSSQHKSEPLAMAVPSRCALLSRAMAAHVAHATPRAFSTSIALRSSLPNKPNSYRNQDQTPSARISPLVGDYPSPPEPKNDFIPPPPPPLSPLGSTAAPANAADQEANPFPYNAKDRFDITDILSQRAAAYGASLEVSNPMDRPRVRTKAVTGRTVFIKERLTPTSAPTPMVAIRVLERMCREQKVKNKFHSQKFHERKGLKRKRLRSERWRARFKVGFKAAVKKVVELKRQGW